jgi:hypothetical protein
VDIQVERAMKEEDETKAKKRAEEKKVERNRSEKI